MENTKLELICPAGTLAALRTAIDAGADAVYVGFRDETNARNFPGLNFSREELAEGIEYAHSSGKMVFIAINTYPQAGNMNVWHRAVDDAITIGVDAVILADIGVLEYARNKHPDARLHLSVQASASNRESIMFYYQEFDIKRIVLPRVLTVQEIAKLVENIPVETEIFAFGGMCPMAEGRCSLSSYITGKSPNQNGVCSPASHVKYETCGDELSTKLGGFTINRFEKNESAGYPTLCKGRFSSGGEPAYLFEEPTSLDIINMLPSLVDAGITALKIEGRQRSKAYVRDVVTRFRSAIDNISSNEVYNLDSLSEGQQTTAGAYRKKWQ